MPVIITLNTNTKPTAESITEVKCSSCNSIIGYYLHEVETKTNGHHKHVQRYKKTITCPACNGEIKL